MKRLIYFFFIYMVSISLYAHEFEVDGIYYNIISAIDKTVEVTHIDFGTEDPYQAGYQYIYQGNISIPESVVYKNTKFTVIAIGEYCFYNSRALSSVEIPSSIKTINESAFQNSTINILSIPNSVERIGRNAFIWCNNLEEVEIPSNVKVLDESAFRECAKLEKLILNEGLDTLGQQFVSGCPVKSIVIPRSTKFIGSSPFHHCKSLQIVLLKSSTIHSFWEEYEYSVFNGCETSPVVFVPQNSSSYFSKNIWSSNIKEYDKSITDADIKELEKSCFLKVQNNIIYRVSSLLSNYEMDVIGCTNNCNEIIIDEHVNWINISFIPNTIKNGSFKNKPFIEQVIIPNNITIIEDESFYGSQNIYKVVSEIVHPFDISTNVFDGVVRVFGKLIVPIGSKPDYMKAEGWKDFANITDISKFKLIYIINGEEYKSYEVEYGATIIPEAAPTKEGYTFSGWSEIPETMPAHDVTVTGTFVINKYKLTYTVDGEEYKSYEVEYGAIITPEEDPTKEGCTFSGWSEIPKTMPAHDVTITGTFTINSYTITYMVDGKEYKTTSVKYGSTITAEAAPTKEGYTFSGWDNIPATMPAHDVTVTGTFTINSYTLTYMVDGVEYKKASVKYGSLITAEAAPTKEGYTFSGWDNIPATMPAHDVTVTGTFTINSYTLT